VNQEHAILSTHLSTYEPLARERLGAVAQGMMAQGMDVASAREAALRIVDGQLYVQANVIAFGKLYLLSGALLVGALPMLLLFRQGKPAPRKPGAAPTLHAD
jgi:DHA2 family multidrug resistance protein